MSNISSEYWLHKSDFQLAGAAFVLLLFKSIVHSHHFGNIHSLCFFPRFLSFLLSFKYMIKSLTSHGLRFYLFAPCLPYSQKTFLLSSALHSPSYHSSLTSLFEFKFEG